MSWARLDDQMLDNRKVLDAGVLGFAVHVAGILYCARNLTDGFVPHAKVETLIGLSGVFTNAGNPTGLPDGDVKGGAGSPDIYAVVDHLLGVGLWHEVPGGYAIHDYLDYNPSRADVLGRRENGKKRTQKWRDAKSDDEGDAPGDTPRDASPDASLPGTGRGSGSGSLPGLESSEKKLPLRVRAREGFPRFWLPYPNKVDKQEALALWVKLDPDAALEQRILEAVERQKRSTQWLREGGRYIPSPARWLRRRKWEDTGSEVPEMSDALARSVGPLSEFAAGGRP